MTLSKTSTSILKGGNTKLNLASKRSHPSYTNRTYSLPPSLRHLPTSLSINSSSSFESLSSIVSSSSSNDSDLDLGKLDEWLVRLDKAAKKSSRKETDGTTRSKPKVSFAITAASSSPKPSRTLPMVIDSVAVASSPLEQHRPAKRRRYGRRNSFIVRDLSQLAQL